MRRAWPGALVLVVALLVLAQVGLPVLAERSVRDELSAVGRVTSVEVSAFPALQLLGKRADSVRVRMADATVGTGDLGDRLASTSRTDSLDVVVDSLAVGPLSVQDVTLRKEGDALVGSAALEDGTLPLDLRPVSSDGGALVFEATLAGVTARVRLSTDDGALIIAPDGLLGGFARVTVFEDPRVRVTGVSAQPSAGGFTVVANATLRSRD